jgi:hypothetical protein
MTTSYNVFLLHTETRCKTARPLDYAPSVDATKKYATQLLSKNSLIEIDLRCGIEMMTSRIKINGVTSTDKKVRSNLSTYPVESEDR